MTVGKEIRDKEKSSNRSGFLISVTAQDQGLPPKISHAALHITFNDKVNIRQPQFETDYYKFDGCLICVSCTFSFTLSEATASNLPVGSFGVSGIEMGHASVPLYFRVLDPQAEQFFKIDRFGTLWLRKSLINIKKRIFEFPVNVKNYKINKFDHIG